MERSQSAPNADVTAETASLAHTLDEGEESDPEDSETPWACSVWVKKTGRRRLLGTLTPAPHHPKVIGVLKMATKLDPVPLAEVKPRMPPSTSSHSLSAGAGGGGGGGIGLGFGAIRQAPALGGAGGPGSGGSSMTTTPTRIGKSASSSFLSRESRETTPTPASPRGGSELFSGFGTIRGRKDTLAARERQAAAAAAAAAVTAAETREREAAVTDAASASDMAERIASEVCMTEENLKDVVCVTAMWLVAREEFGGLGRVKKGRRGRD